MLLPSPRQLPNLILLLLLLLLLYIYIVIEYLNNYLFNVI